MPTDALNLRPTATGRRRWAHRNATMNADQARGIIAACVAPLRLAHWVAAARTSRGEIIVGDSVVGPMSRGKAEQAAKDLAVQHPGAVTVVVCGGDIQIFLYRAGRDRPTVRMYYDDARELARQSAARVDAAVDVAR